MADGKGKGQLKIFSGVKTPMSVDVQPNPNYSFTELSCQRPQKRKLELKEESNVKNTKNKTI